MSKQEALTLPAHFATLTERVRDGLISNLAVVAREADCFAVAREAEQATGRSFRVVTAGNTEFWSSADLNRLKASTLDGGCRVIFSADVFEADCRFAQHFASILSKCFFLDASRA